MQKISFIICLFSLQFFQAQTIELQGKVLTSLDAENIHVYNKTLKKYTITNKLGVFNITVKLNDTLVISSVQHELKSFSVDETMMLEKTLVIALEPLLNNLDEVVVGKVLTGNMLLDVGNVDGEPVTSKSLGIPSYQGKPKTQSQRLLSEAADFNPKLGGSLGGLGVTVSIQPILNAISGRTKKLKNRVVLEEREITMYRIKSRLSKDLFATNTLNENKIMEFFFFVSEEADFLSRTKGKTDVEVLSYLEERLHVYKTNLNQKGQ
ncbi:hypothetical protein [Corallibacter sp.]|uniref:hypothetical protein n=1 Tax=Corallibacter sp. TaxID=2038084 RepID=UPI003AB90F42